MSLHPILHTRWIRISLIASQSSYTFETPLEIPVFYPMQVKNNQLVCVIPEIFPTYNNYAAYDFENLWQIF